jgi:hypothetical protein
MKTKEEQQTDFKAGDMVRCVGYADDLIVGKVYEVETTDKNDIIIKGSCFAYPKNIFELVSTIEKEPVYGQEVWVRDSEDEEWREEIFFTVVNDINCTFQSFKQKEHFELNKGFAITSWKHLRTTDPALDKTTLKLTLQEIAEKYGVDEVIINE